MNIMIPSPDKRVIDIYQRTKCEMSLSNVCEEILTSINIVCIAAERLVQQGYLEAVVPNSDPYKRIYKWTGQEYEYWN